MNLNTARNLIFVVMASTLLFVGYHILHHYQAAEQRQRNLEPQSKESQTEQHSAEVDNQRILQNREWIQSEISRLVDEIQKRRREMDAVQVQLISAQNMDDQGHAEKTYQWDQTRQKEKISGLEQQLKYLQSQKGDAPSRAKTAREQVDINRRQQESDLDTQIETEQNKYQMMKVDAANFRSQKFDLTAQQNWRDMQPKLVAQKQVIDNLKASRKNIKIDADSQKNQLQSDLENAQSQLNAQIQELQNQIAYEKSQYDQISGNYNEAHKSETSQQDLIKRLSKQNDDLKAQLHDLERQLDDRRRELH